MSLGDARDGFLNYEGDSAASDNDVGKPAPGLTRLVLSGGGARCFWQAGALDRIKEELALEPEIIGCVSAGAVVAAAFVAGNMDELRASMRSEFKSLDHNLQLRKLITGKDMIPHADAYRRVIGTVFDAPAIAALKSGPPLMVHLTRPAAWAGPLAPFLGTAVHEAERAWRGNPHGHWCRKLGFGSDQADARDVNNAEGLVRLLTASGCIPPVIPKREWNGKRSLDGALTDNAPVPRGASGANADARTLILCARRYSGVSNTGNCLYLMPSRDLPAHRLDFTDCDAIDAAYALGRQDMESDLPKLNAWVRGCTD